MGPFKRQRAAKTQLEPHGDELLGLLQAAVERVGNATLHWRLTQALEQQISAGGQPSIAWQILAYLLLTSAEILISITALEFSYTQAPPRLKSFVMSLDLLSVALGNFFTARVNAYIEKTGASANLSGANYYWFFMKITAVTTVIFIIVSLFYKGQTYLQDEESASLSA
jgi:POT family proton-dependent oligopeptide transporter